MLYIYTEQARLYLRPGVTIPPHDVELLLDRLLDGRGSFWCLFGTTGGGEFCNQSITALWRLLPIRRHPSSKDRRAAPIHGVLVVPQPNRHSHPTCLDTGSFTPL